VASTVRIPTVLRTAVGGHSTLQIDGATVGEILGKLGADYPNIHDQLFNADGTLHRFLNIYVNDDDVRYIGGLDAPVASGDEVSLLPAVAGGAVA
jgi:molybdopterin synthase sulfur carrier subunit